MYDSLDKEEQAKIKNLARYVEVKEELEKISELEKEIDTTKKELAKIKEKEKTLETNIEQKDKELAETNKKIKELEEKLKETGTNKEKLEKELKLAEESRKNLEESLDKLKKEHKETREALEKKIDELEADLKDLEEKLKDKDKEIIELKKEKLLKEIEEIDSLEEFDKLEIDQDLKTDEEVLKAVKEKEEKLVEELREDYKSRIKLSNMEDLSLIEKELNNNSRLNKDQELKTMIENRKEEIKKENEEIERQKIFALLEAKVEETEELLKEVEYLLLDSNIDLSKEYIDRAKKMVSDIDKAAKENLFGDITSSLSGNIKRLEKNLAELEPKVFRENNQIILGKTIEKIGLGDKESLEKALVDYDKLSEAGKGKLSEEKALLDGLKKRIDDLEEIEKINKAIEDLSKEISMADSDKIKNLINTYASLSDELKEEVKYKEKIEIIEKNFKNLSDLVGKIEELPETLDGHQDKEEEAKKTISEIEELEGKMSLKYKLDRTRLEKIRAELAKISKDGYGAKIKDRKFISLEKALESAIAGDTVVLERDYVLERNVLVKPGVTFLLPIPEDDKGDIIKGGVKVSPDGKVGGKPKLYRTLTIGENLKMDIEGIVMVNAVVGQDRAGNYDQDIRGAYARIILDGDIDIKSGGLLDVFGYVEGSGKIEVRSGGKLGDLYVVRKWRGGSIGYATHNKKIFPFREYDMNNIRTDIKLNSGGSYFGNVRLYASTDHHHTEFYQVDNEKGLLKMKEDSYLIKKYDKDKKISTMELHGDIEEIGGKMELDLGFLSPKFETKSRLYPLDGHIKFVISEGQTTINNQIKAFPGAELVIEKAGEFLIKEKGVFVSYKEFNDNFTKVSNTNYPKRESKPIINRGTIKIDGSFAGEVIMDKPGSKIIINQGSKLSVVSDEPKNATGSGPFSTKVEVMKLTNDLKVKSDLGKIGYKKNDDGSIEIGIMDGENTDYMELGEKGEFILVEEALKDKR